MLQKINFKPQPKISIKCQQVHSNKQWVVRDLPVVDLISTTKLVEKYETANWSNPLLSLSHFQFRICNELLVYISIVLLTPEEGLFANRNIGQYNIIMYFCFILLFTSSSACRDWISLPFHIFPKYVPCDKATWHESHFVSQIKPTHFAKQL